MSDVPSIARWAWIAGVIEGDGCLTFARRNRSAYVIVAMTDQDVLLRLKEWSEAGSVNGPYWPSAGHNKKPLYHWTVSGHEQVERVLRECLPWFGMRRRTRAVEILTFLEGRVLSNARKTHCKNNHEFTPENTYRHGQQRHCRTCRTERARARRRAAA